MTNTTYTNDDKSIAEHIASVAVHPCCDRIQRQLFVAIYTESDVFLSHRPTDSIALQYDALNCVAVKCDLKAVWKLYEKQQAAW